MHLDLSKDDVAILVASIISYELSKQNNTYFPLHFDVHQRGDFSKAPFFCDSLSLVTLATAVGEYFNLKESGLEEHFIRYRDFESWVDIVCDSLRHYSEGITFFTSGTTGEPKRIFHSMQSLAKEARYLATLLTGAKRVCAFVRPHHIYGFLYTIALPKYLGADATFHEPIPNNAFFDTPQNSLLISTPTLYEIVAKKGGRFLDNITAVSSTQLLEKKTKEQLKDCGIAKIIEIYGSSESLGVGYRRDFSEEFTLFEYLQKNALPTLQDRLEWSSERTFALGSRVDEKLKSKGYLIDTQEYQKKLQALTGVSECEVVWTKGQLVAFISPIDKNKAMQSIANMQEKKPDSIVWIDT